MRILITGKNSYIGNSFKNYLKDKPDYKIQEISVRDDSWKSISFKGIDVIIHLAALVHKNSNKYSLKFYEKVNVELTSEIAKKAIYENVKKFVFLSSMAVFGKTKVINSKSPLIPTTNYGITKLKAEMCLKSLQLNSKMNLTIIRPPMIYGEGAKGNPNLIEKISNFSSYFPDSLNKRSFLSINNLNLVLFNEINSIGNKIIHPQDSKYFSTFDLFQYYRSQLNKNAFPLKRIGFFLKKLTFLSIINKIFGDLYYDFYD